MINKERLLHKFLEYVQIDSESGNEKAMGEQLVKDLTALGLEVHTDQAGTKCGSNGFNVYARLKGTLAGEPLIYSSHMDTVVPGVGVKPQIKDGIIYSDGTTVLGGDDKSGIAAIMEALTTIKENGLPCHTVEVAFSIGEETGMLGAKNMDCNWFTAKKAVVLDHGGEIGNMVNRGPGQLKLFATVIGRAAHAGLAPEKGISAIQVAAKGIAQMQLLRIDEETTCNIGTFKSIGATNIVPAKAEIIGEIRSRNLDKLNAHANSLVHCLQKACDEAGATLECELRTNYSSFNVPEDDPFLQRLTKVYEALGCPVEIEAGGGGSDANIFALHGITPIIVSTGMTNVHTTQELLKISDLEKAGEFVFGLMTRE